MELSLRLDTLGMVEMRYLRTRERYRDWPPFQLLAASRQARVITYLTRDVAEQLHQQILAVESAVGLDVNAGDDDDDDDDEGENSNGNGFQAEESEKTESTKPSERESNAFSPAFAQALKQLNELARQRLPDSGSGQTTGELTTDSEGLGDDEDALEQLQDAFVQMMEVVRELAEELSTDALKLTGRFKCARTNIEFVPRPVDADDDDDDDEEDEDEDVELELEREGIMEIELTLVLQLFEEGRTRADDVPAVELQLDVDDFERLHETLDFALDRDRSSRRRRS
ncbi:MAG: hypothetical protein PVS3B3_11210 [Ktedonobacteraceae bacterium]